VVVGGTDSAGLLLEYDGRRWEQQTLPDGTPRLRACAAAGGGDVVAVGDGGTVIKDAETGWRTDEGAASVVPPDAVLTGVWAASFDQVWVVGARGDAGFAARRAGPTWSVADVDAQRPLRGVWGSAADDVWAVGDGGAILHHDGEAWTPVPSPTASSLLAITGSGRREAFAVGADGDIGIAIEWNGSAWSMFASAPEPLLAVWTAAERPLFAGGSAGRLLRYRRAAGRPDPSRQSSDLPRPELSVHALVGRAGDSFVVAAVAEPAPAAGFADGTILGHRIELAGGVVGLPADAAP
jgi:hypothetical protein